MRRGNVRLPPPPPLPPLPPPLPPGRSLALAYCVFGWNASDERPKKLNVLALADGRNERPAAAAVAAAAAAVAAAAAAAAERARTRVARESAAAFAFHRLSLSCLFVVVRRSRVFMRLVICRTHTRARAPNKRVAKARSVKTRKNRRSFGTKTVTYTL